MSNNYEWLDDEDFDDILSDVDEDNDANVLRKVRKANRAKDKQLKELMDKLQEYEARDRSQSLKAILESKGVNPKVAKLLPADLDISDEGVSTWLAEFGDVFGVEVAPNQNDSGNASIDEMRQMGAVTDNALIPDGVVDVYNALNNAQSIDDVLGLIYGAGES